MDKDHDLKSDERVPFSLFHAAVEREKEQQKKQPVQKSNGQERKENE